MTVTTPPSRRARAVRASGLLCASVLVHAAFFGAPAASSRLTLPAAPRPALVKSAHLAERVAAVTRPVSLAAARRELVDRARLDRDAGSLQLGEFLLAASAL